MRVVAIAVVVAVAVMLPPGVAVADDKAAAEALFDDAQALAKAGDYAKACPKFEASYKFDPAIGTKLNLADCHEHVGKLATAWAEYREVEDATKPLSDDKSQDRNKRAHDHAAALAPRLSRLRIDPPPSPPPGLVVKRDGEDVTAILGTAVPVDPGAHAVDASAPGVHAWSATVTVAGEGTTTPLAIPALAIDAGPPPPPPPPPPPVKRVGIGGSISAGLLLVPDLQFPDGCHLPSHGGAALAPSVFVDTRVASRLRVRAGVISQVLFRGYANNDNMGNPLCPTDAPPKNLYTMLIGPFAELEPRLVGDAGAWDVHALVGGTLTIPLGNGEDDVAGGNAKGVPGVSFGSPVQLAADVGLGVRTHGVSFEVIGRLFATAATSALDIGTDKLLLLQVAYSSL